MARGRHDKKCVCGTLLVEELSRQKAYFYFGRYIYLYLKELAGICLLGFGGYSVSKAVK